MLEIYICALAIVLASLAVGGALLRLLGWPGPLWLAGASGFAVLVVLAPFLIRLPGRATSAAILLGLLALLGAAHLYRERARAPERAPAPGARAAALATALALAALAALPFLLHDRIGILGEGIYTNDHAAQLYWADWLQNGFGPQPSAVRFGYPIGPQALVAVVSSATAIDLVAAFNGLLVAIVVLSGLTALGALARLALPARVTVATLTGLTYLGASFLAQSAFKETAMALFVLAFAIALGSLSGPDPSRRSGPPRSAVLALDGDPRHRERAHLQPPGAALDRGRAAAVAAAGGAGRAQPDRLGGRCRLRLAPPPRPRRCGARGRGDRGARDRPCDLVHRSDRRRLRIAGPAELADLPGRGLRGLARRRLPDRPRRDPRLADRDRDRLAGGRLRRLGTASPPPVRAPGNARRGPARLSRHPAVRPDSRRGEGARGDRAAGRAGRAARAARARRARAPGAGRSLGPGSLPARGARSPCSCSARACSRCAPPRSASRSAAPRSSGSPNGPRARRWSSSASTASAPTGCATRSPAPPAATSPRRSRIGPRSSGSRVGRSTSTTSSRESSISFRYAITTPAAYASAPPPNFTAVAEDSEYVLWRRQGHTPPSDVLEGEFGPGVESRCAGAGPRRPARAPREHLRDLARGRRPRRLERRAARRARRRRPGVRLRGAGEADQQPRAPARRGVRRSRCSTTRRSPLTVSVAGEEIARLPPTLEGMYLDGAGRGAFWPAGSFEAAPRRASRSRWRPPKPGGIDGLRSAASGASGSASSRRPRSAILGPSSRRRHAATSTTSPADAASDAGASR